MTTITLQSLNFSTKAFEGLGNFFKKSLKSLVFARQVQANREIVPYLRHEYKGKSDQEILVMLNQIARKEYLS